MALMSVVKATIEHTFESLIAVIQLFFNIISVCCVWRKLVGGKYILHEKVS